MRLKRKGISTNNLRLYKYEHYSPETGISVVAIRYDCEDLFVLLKSKVKDYIKESYVNEWNKTKKKKKDTAYTAVYTKVIQRYFEWLIEKCIEGHSVALFNNPNLIAKVTRYVPTSVENTRVEQLRKEALLLAAKKNMEITFVETEDFFLNKYRISLLKTSKENSLHYVEAGYFIRLPNKQNKELEKQITKNPEVYGDIAVQFSGQLKSTKNLRLFTKRL